MTNKLQAQLTYTISYGHGELCAENERLIIESSYKLVTSGHETKTGINQTG